MAKAKSPPSRPPRSILPIRIYRAHDKLVIATVCGIFVALAALAFDTHMLTRVLIGWNGGIVIYLALVAAVMSRADVASIRRRAALEDEGAIFILLLSAAATCASLVAILFALTGSKQAGAGSTEVWLAIATILLSWAFVHTIFSFHYAHEYYGERRDGQIGGLEFPGDKAPDYRDFLYFSLVIGMTSQVSDVVITSKYIRRMVAAHGVLSFFFNLVVLALTVNMVASLL